MRFIKNIWGFAIKFKLSFFFLAWNTQIQWAVVQKFFFFFVWTVLSFLECTKRQAVYMWEMKVQHYFQKTFTTYFVFPKATLVLFKNFLRRSLMWLMQITGLVFVYATVCMGHWGKLGNGHVTISFCTFLSFSRPILWLWWGTEEGGRKQMGQNISAFSLI